MSRFDDFAKRRASEGMSRRDLIKRAGIVGGATLAGSALIQSVNSTAFAAVSNLCTDPANASEGCGATCGATNLCPNGRGCNVDADCGSGYCDLDTSKCAAPPQGTVPAGEPCHATDPFTANHQCESLYCAGGVCAPFSPLLPRGSTCTSGTQCASLVCEKNGFVGTCA